ncbi:MAG TPA: NUDIX hydrolase [Phototrophicaceae bacterium]|nr:NUDIX hydrolase [Phototrophicaceae bacterium]
MQPWKTLSRRTILEHNKFLSIENHVIQLPDGREIPDWPWVVTPSYINVAAVTTDGRFLCFRQTKYAVSGTSLASVGGYIEPGEDPLAAAQRELLEETGYRADTWTSLGQYVVDGNRGAGVANLFLAQGAYPVAAADADDLEEQEPLLLTRAEVEAALAAGEFKVLGWATVMALALLRLKL